MPAAEKYITVQNPAQIMALSLADILQKRLKRELVLSTETHHIPQSAIIRGLPQKKYDEAKGRVNFFCTDLVVTTYVPTGEPALVYALRNPNAFLGGLWWPIGGVTFPATNPEDHLCDKCVKELGFPVLVEAPMSLWMTTFFEKHPKSNVPPYVSSTVQVCYVGWAPFEIIESKIKLSNRHTDVRIFTKKMLKEIPKGQSHVYPITVGEEGLGSMPDQEHYKGMKDLYFSKFSEHARRIPHS